MKRVVYSSVALLIVFGCSVTESKSWGRTPSSIKVPNLQTHFSGRYLQNDVVLTTETNDRYVDARKVALTVPRGGGGPVDLVTGGLNDLSTFLKGGLRLDSLLLLAASAFTAPVCLNVLGISPILGYLLLGMVTGPNGFNLVKDLHTTEVLAELGVVFFLFEMGIELSVSRLLSMKQDVFGLGGSQVLVTALVLGLLGKVLTPLSTPALIVISWGLALSSSAFVLQLLRDKDALDSRYGQASFGVLLLQDLAVVPLLVLTPILAGTGGSLGSALAAAGVKALMAFGIIGLIGKFGLLQALNFVDAANNQQAFLSLVMLAVVAMSFLTEGLGLSNTLGAFLAGVLLSETKQKHKIELEVAPVRSILVAIFFLTVGFEIDPVFIKDNWLLVLELVGGILAIKTAVTTILSQYVFKLSKSNSQRCGAILSQGGEFAFVAFNAAKNFGLLNSFDTKALMTAIALTMAATPSLLEFTEQVRTYSHSSI